jgi:hypothetical protein
MESDVTLGKLCKPDGSVFCCTLEEPWKDNKRKISCIPAGKYKCVKHNSAKYQDVWRLENVIGRDGILIHAGNTTDDIEGCILVGKSYGTLKGKPAVLDSRSALSDLRLAIKGDFYLRVVDRLNKEGE